MSSSTAWFPAVPEIRFESAASDDPLAFKHDDADAPGQSPQAPPASPDVESIAGPLIRSGEPTDPSRAAPAYGEFLDRFSATLEAQHAGTR